MKDMPENEDVAKILRGNQIHYFTCLELVEVLKKTEADSKNIFGYYSSQRMKEWQDIIKIYQKDNLYLAEIAQIISRNVVHEIPSIKRAIAKHGSIAAECNKKSTEYMKLSSRLKAEYMLAASKLGITGDDVQKELLEQLYDFPKLIDQIYLGISTSLRSPVDFFANFVNAVGSDRSELLPTIEYLLDKGNTTVYELRRGEKPVSIEKSQNDPLEPVADDAIDFGEDGDDAIDFGDDPKSVSGSSDSNGNGFVHVHELDTRRDSDTNGSTEVIDWDVERENPDKDLSKDKIAKGDEALSILEFNETRESVVNEVSELEAFLSQRLLELTSDNETHSFALDQGISQVLSNQADVSNMLSAVQGVIQLMTSEKIKVLYMIKDNPKYIERAVDSLKSRLDMAQKAEEKSRLMDQKESDALDEQAKLSSAIPGLVEQTRCLQVLVETEVSKRYKNRRVNLMGVAQVL